MPSKLKWILVVFMTVSFIGFLDAVYLTIQHYRNGLLPCYVFEGCDEVIRSEYAAVLGVPVALAGAIYYFILFVAAIAFFESGSTIMRKAIISLPFLGFAASIYFVSLQLFVIRAVCLYCMISAASSTLLVILAVLLIKMEKRKKSDKQACC